MKTAEEMRERVLALIQDWITNSNAKDNEQCVMLLNALAGDIQIISVEPVSPKAAEAPGGQDDDWISSSDRPIELQELELNHERLITAVMCGLDELQRRVGEVATLPWFQEGYREAIQKLRNADEATIFEERRGKPTLTGATLVVAPAALSERADEREKFEQWARRRTVDAWEGWAFELDGDGDYMSASLQYSWESWQARAGLSSQEGE